MNTKITVGLFLTVLTSIGAQASCLDVYNRVIAENQSLIVKHHGALDVGVSASSTAVVATIVSATPTGGAVVAGSALTGLVVDLTALNSLDQLNNATLIRDLLVESQVGTGLNLNALAEKSQSSIASVAEVVTMLDSRNAFCGGNGLLTARQVSELVLRTLSYTK